MVKMTSDKDDEWNDQGYDRRKKKLKKINNEKIKKIGCNSALKQKHKINEDVKVVNEMRPNPIQMEKGIDRVVNNSKSTYGTFYPNDMTYKTRLQNFIQEKWARIHLVSH